MKKVDLIIWVLAGLVLFLTWSRFVGRSYFFPEEEKWITKARQMMAAGAGEIEIRAMLARDAGYSNGKIIDKIYNTIAGTSPSS